MGKSKAERGENQRGGKKHNLAVFANLARIRKTHRLIARTRVCGRERERESSRDSGGGGVGNRQMASKEEEKNSRRGRRKKEMGSPSSSSTPVAPLKPPPSHNSHSPHERRGER